MLSPRSKAMPDEVRAAVELALAGKNAVMPAITRTSDKPYRWKITPAPLEKVANVAMDVEIVFGDDKTKPAVCQSAHRSRELGALSIAETRSWFVEQNDG